MRKQLNALILQCLVAPEQARIYDEKATMALREILNEVLDNRMTHQWAFKNKPEPFRMDTSGGRLRAYSDPDYCVRRPKAKALPAIRKLLAQGADPSILEIVFAAARGDRPIAWFHTVAIELLNAGAVVSEPTATALFTTQRMEQHQAHAMVSGALLGAATTTTTSATPTRRF